MTATLTSGAKVAIADDGTAIGSFANVFEVESCTVRKESTIINSSGIRGTRSHQAERSRDAGYIVQGDLVLHPSPALLDILLPYIMGTAESVDVFAFSETLNAMEFALLVDYGPERILYDDCKVSRATFRSSEGDFLQLTLSIMGKTATTSATAFPSITIPNDAHDEPFIHSDVAVTLEGTGSRLINDFELTIDHAIKAIFRNSLTATDLIESDRIVTAKCTVPYASSPDTTDLYETAVAGAAATWLFTNAANTGLTLDFTAGRFQIPARGPTLPNRNDEVTLELDGMCRMVDTTRELVITNDSVA